MIQFFCFSCNKKLEFAEIFRSSECHHCGADVRVCKNCEFYDEKLYNECRETSAEPVREKERSNFCDFFKVKTSREKTEPKKDQLSAAEALFKK